MVLTGCWTSTFRGSLKTYIFFGIARIFFLNFLFTENDQIKFICSTCLQWDKDIFLCNAYSHDGLCYMTARQRSLLGSDMGSYMRWFMLCSHLIRLKTFYLLAAHLESLHLLAAKLVPWINWWISREEWDFLSPLTVFKWCCWSKSIDGFATILQQRGKRKDKDYSCQQEMGRGEQNKTKPGFHNQRNGSVLIQCKPGLKKWNVFRIPQQ